MPIQETKPFSEQLKEFLENPHQPFLSVPLLQDSELGNLLASLGIQLNKPQVLSQKPGAISTLYPPVDESTAIHFRVDTTSKRINSLDQRASASPEGEPQNTLSLVRLDPYSGYYGA